MDTQSTSDAPASPRARSRIPRILTAIAGIVVLLVLGTVALLGFLPVGMLRGTLEQKLSSSYGAPVTVGSLTRSPGFSFTPDVTANDVRIAQPGWVPGGGDFVRLRSATVRVPVFSALFGHFRPERLTVAGAEVALYRSLDGRSNWKRDRNEPEATSHETPSITDLTIADSAISLRDAKRGLTVRGPISLDNVHGLHWSAHGQFQQTPATFVLTGGRVVGVEPGAPYPFVGELTSPALHLKATGVSDGVLNLRHFSATIETQAPTLKNVDRMIEAGLFGTQPVDLTADIRHDGRDWVVKRIVGTIGRSRFVGRATVNKLGDGDTRRTMITASLRATLFDFDDLADSRGQAASAARRASIGPRVLPPTRINLSKLGRTDGEIAFRIDRVMSHSGSVFRTLQGDLTLDHRLLTVRNTVATFADGRMTGTVRVDHRSGRPKLTLDLRTSGATLASLLGGSDVADAAVRGRILLSGQGDTVREALSHADGKAAMVATAGSIKRTVADVLGQDLSGTVLHAISAPSARVPLRCLVADFRARGGVLTPAPLAIDTGTSVGRGTGRIVLDGETIAITLAGASKRHSLLRIADPIRISGTLSAPVISVANLAPGSKPAAGGILKVLGRSLGQALGLTKMPPSAVGDTPVAFDCTAAVASALR